MKYKLIYKNRRVHLLIFLCILQSGQSALQVWGIYSNDWEGQDAEVEDEDKEVFEAHVEALFADVL